MEDGRLTDAHGRIASFKNVIVIGTSNIGTKSLSDARKGIGFGQKQTLHEYKEMRSAVLSECQKFFKPEFLNRLDDLIVFHTLTREQIRQITDLMVSNLNQRLAGKKMHIEVSVRTRDKLAIDGYSETYGARPLRRLIEDKIENPLSVKIINGELRLGSDILVDLDANGEYTFNIKT